MSKTRKSGRRVHWDKESATNRRRENRRRRQVNNQRVRLQLDPRRFRGTEAFMTW